MLNNKIKNILLVKDMSPSKFADEIGVQRSSISHILSGRNKPSLEIIQKIVKRFPDLGWDWIIDEEETVEEDEVIEEPTQNLNKLSNNTIQEKSAISSNKVEISKPLTNTEETNTDKRKVERILIFYSDKTFSEYKPE